MSTDLWVWIDRLYFGCLRWASISSSSQSSRKHFTSREIFDSKHASLSRLEDHDFIVTSRCNKVHYINITTRVYKKMGLILVHGRQRSMHRFRKRCRWLRTRRRCSTKGHHQFCSRGIATTQLPWRWMANSSRFISISSKIEKRRRRMIERLAT